MPTEVSTEALTLWPLSGPPLSPAEFDPAKTAVLGRAAESDVRLEAPTVSRRHADVSHKGGRWFVTDLGSRHGTLVNSLRLAPETPTPLSWGDLVTIGPWTFRVQWGSRGASTIQSVDDRPGAGQIRSVDIHALAASRLRLLMDSAERIHAAADEQALAREVTTLVVDGTSFTCASLVRALGGVERVELLATSRRGGVVGGEHAISRSLLGAARAGDVVLLESRHELREAVSIIGAGVQSAICAPVVVGAAVDAFLYADCDQRPSGPDPEAPAFIAALARICGLALAGLRRTALERQQRDLVRELTGAREVQRRMMPPARGRVGPLKFCFMNRPGKVVAGDICGVAELAGGRGAFFIGDVAGKGLGPSLIMASTQAYLAAALASIDDPGRLVSGVNDYLATHSAAHEFASLWFAIAAPGGALRCVDAGHGLAVVIRGNQPERLNVEGGLAIGVDQAQTYGSTEIRLDAGDRLVLFSDGLVEQNGADDDQFGQERIVQALKNARSCEQDVDVLTKALAEFAEGDSYADDVTIASFEPA